MKRGGVVAYTGYKRIPVIGLLLLALLLGACGSEQEDPEAQVRAVLEQGETAIEGHDLDTLRDLISDDYDDEQGKDKRSVMQLIRYYFLTNRSIYLLTQIEALTFPEPARAEVVMRVGMASRPGEGVLDWSFFRADIYRFDFTLAREGGAWKVVGATWRRASLDETQ